MAEPPIIVEHAARAVIKMTQHGQDRTNVLHFYRDAPFDEDTLQTLCNNLLDWWHDLVRPNVTNQLSVVEVIATSLEQLPGIQQSSPCISECSGTHAGEPEPGNVTGTTTLRTGFAGRRYRGRYYWPGFVTGATNNDDTITSSYAVAMAIAGANLVFGYLQNSVLLAVLSRVGEFITPVNQVGVNNVLDSMRSRLPGRGA
jgi:hypothetical protein